MNLRMLMSAALLCLFALTGCHRTETASKTDKDVAEAQNDATKHVAEARKDAKEERQEASNDVRDEEQEAAGEDADARYKVAVAKAEGEHKVALEQCDAINGSERSACKDKADNALDEAKAQAQSERDAVKR